MIVIFFCQDNHRKINPVQQEAKSVSGDIEMFNIMSDSDNKGQCRQATPWLREDLGKRGGG